MCTFMSVKSFSSNREIISFVCPMPFSKNNMPEDDNILPENETSFLISSRPSIPENKAEDGSNLLTEHSTLLSSIGI